MDPGRLLERPRGVRTDAGVIVVEHERRGVERVPGSARAPIPRTEIAVFDVRGERSVFPGYGLTDPGSILAVGGNDDPLFPERVPPLLPAPLVCQADESRSASRPTPRPSTGGSL
jgi:hypothetical protein